MGVNVDKMDEEISIHELENLGIEVVNVSVTQIIRFGGRDFHRLDFGHCRAEWCDSTISDAFPAVIRFNGFNMVPAGPRQNRLNRRI